jgi:hypothetical protein
MPEPVESLKINVAKHHEVVPAGSGYLKCSLGALLPLDVGEVG